MSKSVEVQKGNKKKEGKWSLNWKLCLKQLSLFWDGSDETGPVDVQLQHKPKGKQKKQQFKIIYNSMCVNDSVCNKGFTSILVNMLIVGKKRHHSEDIAKHSIIENRLTKHILLTFPNKRWDDWMTGFDFIPL